MKKILFTVVELILFILLLSQNPPGDRDAPTKVDKRKNGEIGLNVLGFHVNVGVEPVLAPNGVGGTIHSQAGTPFGQSAAAGAQGHVGINHAAGIVYDRATASPGVAAAGVGAEAVVSPTGPMGILHAEAYSGDVFRGIVLGNADEPTLSMAQQQLQRQTISDINHIIRNPNKESTNTATCKNSTQSNVSVKGLCR